MNNVSDPISIRTKLQQGAQECNRVATEAVNSLLSSLLLGVVVGWAILWLTPWEKRLNYVWEHIFKTETFLETFLWTLIHCIAFTTIVWYMLGLVSKYTDAALLKIKYEAALSRMDRVNCEQFLWNSEARFRHCTGMKRRLAFFNGQLKGLKQRYA